MRASIAAGNAAGHPIAGYQSTQAGHRREAKSQRFARELMSMYESLNVLRTSALTLLENA